MPYRHRQPEGSSSLPSAEEIVGGEADVLSNLANEGRADVAPAMHRNGSGASIRVAKLFVRTALTDFGKVEVLQNRNDFARFERRDTPHTLRNLEGVRPNKLRLELRLAVFEQHGDYLPEVGLELLHGGALRVSARPAWHKSHKEACLLITLDDGSESAH